MGVLMLWRASVHMDIKTLTDFSPNIPIVSSAKELDFIITTKGKQAKGKSRYIKDAIILPTINCDIAKAATNVTIDFSLTKCGKSIL